MGKVILGYFGQTKKAAITSYRKYIESGLENRDNFEGGGLIRSVGGKFNASQLRGKEREMSDERILGSGDFVLNILSQIEEARRTSRQIATEEELLARVCRYYKITVEEMLERATKGVRQARSVYVYMGREYLGKSITGLGQRLGISHSAASMAYSRGKGILRDLGGEEVVLR